MRMFRTLLTTVSIVVAIASPGAGPDAFRPPAIPLVTHDPYFSIWSTSDRLTDRPTSHWTGTPHPMSALVRIDGHASRIMGHLPANVPALTQRSVTVLPLRTVYVFDGAGIELTLTFLSPMLPHDLELVSRPASYVTFQARATDGRAHDVAVYFDASSQIAVNSPNQPVNWDASRDDALERLRVGSVAQPVLAKDGDNLRIDWGYLYVAVPKAAGTTTRIARDVDAQRSFVTTGALPAADTTDAPRPVDDRTPVLAVAFALGSVQRRAGVAPRHRRLRRRMVDRVLGERARPWWRRNGADAPAMLRAAEADYTRLVTGERGLRHRADARSRSSGAATRTRASRRWPTGRRSPRTSSSPTPKRRAALLLQGELQQRLHRHRRRDLPVVAALPALRPELLARRCSCRCSTTPRSPRWKFPFAPHDLGTLSARPTARSTAAASRPRRTRCRSRRAATC